MAKDDGGPAFPTKGGMVFYTPAEVTEQVKTEVERLKDEADGMSLRDAFAIAALKSMGTWMPNYWPNGDPVQAPAALAHPERLAARAAWSYAQADAMLRVRAEGRD